MTWTTLVNFPTGQLIDQTIWNNILGAAGNLAGTAPGVVTTAGDIPYGTAANTIARFPMGAANGGKVLKANLLGTAPTWGAGGLFDAYALLVNRQLANVPGGAFTTGAMRPVVINNEVFDTDNIVALSHTANQFLLKQGNTYCLRWTYATSSGVQYHISQLYDVTNAAAGQVGIGILSPGVGSGTARVTTGATVDTEYRIEAETNVSGTFGYDFTFASVAYNVFATLEIFREV